MLSDYDYLVQELKAQHKGLYLHQSPAIVNAQLDSIRNTLSSPREKVEFYRAVMAAIAITNEGHTWAALPKKYQAKLGTKKAFLPLSIRFKDRKAIVRQYFGEEPTSIKAGMEVTAINGTPMPELVANIAPYIPTDGFNQTSTYEWLGWQFSLMYRMVLGPQDSYTLQVANAKGEVQTVELEPVRYTRFKAKKGQLEMPKLSLKKLSYTLVNDSIGYLAINSFSQDPKTYGPWLKEQFTKIKSDGVKHLILDVQANGGGTEGNENLLVSYLVEEPFEKYAYVSMAKKPYLKREDSKSLIEDKWGLAEGEARRGDFTLQSNYFSDLGYEDPDPSLLYSGKLYVLIGGQTFSGGAEFSSMIKMTRRGTMIGDETGGAYEGNVSGYAQTIKLPKSKIKVSLPIVHFRINAFPTVKSRGVMPDYQVPQDPVDYVQGINTRKEFAIRLITGQIYRRQ